VEKKGSNKDLLGVGRYSVIGAICHRDLKGFYSCITDRYVA